MRVLAVVVLAVLMGVAVWLAFGAEADRVATEPDRSVEQPSRQKVGAYRLVVTAVEASTSLTSLPDTPMRLPTTAEAPLEHTLVIRTRTADGSVVPHLRVDASRVGWQDVLGETDEGGQLVVTLTDAAPLRVVARGPRHASAVSEVDPMTDDSVDLIVRSAGAILGSVHWIWGEPVGAALVVQALETGHRLDPHDQADLHAEVGRVVTAVTDTEGSFRLDGLDPERLYSVSVAGPGVLAPAPLDSVRPDGEPIQIPVGRVFATVLQLREPDGAPLRTAPSLRHVGRSFPGGLGRRFGPARQDVGPLQLEALRGLPDDDLLLLYVGYEDVHVFGPLDVAVAVPGYEPVKTTLQLPPLAESIEVRRLALRPTVDRMGELHVLFFGGPPAPQPAAVGRMSSAPVWLVLDQLDGGDSPVLDWRVPLRDWPRQGEVFELPGVPVGSYRVSLEAEHQLFAFPSRGADGPAPVLVDGVTPVTLDSPPLGNLLVSLSWPDGRPFRDAAVVTVTDLRADATGSVAFDHGPYLVEGLPPGPMAVSVLAPFPAGSRSARAQVQVQAGVTARLDVVTAPLR